jgi:hypothetical protein
MVDAAGQPRPRRRRLPAGRSDGDAGPDDDQHPFPSDRFAEVVQDPPSARFGGVRVSHPEKDGTFVLVADGAALGR